MKVEQIYSLVNDVTKEVLGDSVILAEDLSNVVDVGQAIFDTSSFDHYVKKLIDKVGRVVFVNRVYKGWAPNILKDGWEYGAAMQKVASFLPEATENEDWQLTDKTSYDPFVTSLPDAVSKFYNKRVTFEIDRTITEEQLKSAFQSATELNGFVSMIFNEVDKSMTIKTDALIMRVINSMVADTIHDDFGDEALSSKSGKKAVNLLKLYNDRYSKTLSAENAVTDPDFLRYACYIMGLYMKRMKGISTMFNIGKQPRFTPDSELHVVMLSEFESASGIYLQADTYHDELVKMPRHETVPFWQGSGDSYAFNDTSAISVTSGNGNAVTATGILCVMFDHEACGVSNIKDTVNTQYNPKANYTNYFYKRFEGLYTDGNENCVVFFVA